jgi:glycerophosphoryl diester phosphodiesterase
MDREHLVAHRGWQRRYPENTLPAIAGALDAGARYVEVDVQLSADGVPVLFHDRTLSRICRQRGAIHRYTAAELQQFSAFEPERFEEKFLGTAIPTLTALVDLLLQYPDAYLFLEIKNLPVLEFGNEKVYDAVIPLLQPLAERCTVISFAHDFLHHALARGWPHVGPVLNDWREIDTASIAALQPDVVFCAIEQLPAQRDLSAIVHPLAVYEVDRIDIAEDLLQRGVRWIETFAVGELLAANP